MSIVTTRVPVEVTVREDVRTEYVCDGCEQRYVLGSGGNSVAINALHPPRSWWEIKPADGFDMYAARRPRHACSSACLHKVAEMIAAEDAG